MGVIAFPNLSPQGPNPTFSWELRSISARHKSPLNGVATTLERPGSEWAVRMPYANLATSRRARLQTFAAAARGHAQRFYVPYYGWTRRGSFSVSEMLTNNEFSNGTTSWTINNDYVGTVSDNIMRLTRVEMGGAVYPLVGSVTPTQYAPHALRVQRITGRGTFASHQLTDAGESTDTGSSSVLSSADGLYTLAYVPIVSGARNVGLFDAATNGQVYGDYFEVPYTSYARCAMVDNGPNALLRSDAFDNASWTKVALAAPVADSNVAPDGTTTAENIVETTANSTHELQQAVATTTAAQDLCFCVAIAPGTRTWVHLVMTEATGSTSGGAYFNLATGAVGTIVNGANMTNTRAFVVDMGLTYKYCCIVVRKANAATSVNARIMLATSDGGAGAYVGSAAGTAVVVWRATLARSALPVRLTQTTTTAIAPGTAQTGSRFHVKGLPASTNGLALVGDPIEIMTATGNSEFKRVKAPLNSDAAGRGSLEFEPPIRGTVGDNAAVIFQRPLCKMMMDSNVTGWSERAAGFSDLEFTAVEDTYP